MSQRKYKKGDRFQSIKDFDDWANQGGMFWLQRPIPLAFVQGMTYRTIKSRIARGVLCRAERTTITNETGEINARSQ